MYFSQLSHCRIFWASRLLGHGEIAMESPLPRVDWADPRHLEILAKAVSPEGPGRCRVFVVFGEVFRHETCETARETWVRVQHIKKMFHPNELLLDLIQQEWLVGYCGGIFFSGFPMIFSEVHGKMVLLCGYFCYLIPKKVGHFLRCLNMLEVRVLSWVRILLLEVSRCNCGTAGGRHSAIVSRILRPPIGRKGSSEDACLHRGFGILVQNGVPINGSLSSCKVQIIFRVVVVVVLVLVRLCLCLCLCLSLCWCLR